MENVKKLATSILKAELAKRDLSLKDLQKRLEAIGMKEPYDNIRLRINRGTFSFAFFLECMEAIGVKTLGIESYFEDWEIQQASGKPNHRLTNEETKAHKRGE